jgi:hypothetical protein
MVAGERVERASPEKERADHEIDDVEHDMTPDDGVRPDPVERPVVSGPEPWCSVR